MHSNRAVEDGGGIRVESRSSLLCTSCDFRNNVAIHGGGMHTWANDSVPIVAQIQDSSFVNNTAYNDGGKDLL